MKPAVFVLLLSGFTLAVAQPTPTYRDVGPAKTWVDGKGWVPVDSSSSSSNGPDLGSALGQLIERRALAAAARRAAEEEARQGRATKTSELNRKATEALRAQNYREALRLYREQQKVIDGPNVRAGISETEALIIWTEATTSADLRRALKMRPDLFDQDNRNFVAYLEGHERAGQALAHLADSLTAAGTTPALIASAMTVDTRNLAPALPKPLDDLIGQAYKDSPAEVRDEVRKGFQAVMKHDWVLAKAWFEQAMIHDPANPALLHLAQAARSPTGQPVKPSAAPPISDGDEEKMFGKEFVTAFYRAALLDSHRADMPLPDANDIWFMFPNIEKTPGKSVSGRTGPVQQPEEKDVEFLFLPKTPSPKLVPASKN